MLLFGVAIFSYIMGNFVEMLDEFNESGNESINDSDKIIEYLLVQAQGSSRTLLHIITDFLKNSPQRKIGKVLLYCLIGIFRKNEKI